MEPPPGIGLGHPLDTTDEDISELLTNEFASFLLHREQRLILPASYTPSRAGAPAFSPHF